MSLATECCSAVVAIIANKRLHYQKNFDTLGHILSKGNENLRFSPEFIQNVIDKNDIAEIIGQTVQLKGSSSLMGLCPFHNEKSPSFSVSKDKQLYHCFGCGVGGTVINFVMQQDGLDFVEAVKSLAERAGMDIPQESSHEPVLKADERERLYNLNIEAAKFYRENLHKSVGKQALEYAQKRQLTELTIKKFGLGYAPADNSIIKHLQDLGYLKEEMRAAGILVEGENGDYLRFRDRLMFPIIDLRKNVISFGGRALGDIKPKYLNGANTPIFNKSYNLFALNFAKNSNADFLILCEGYMDVISLHQAGFDSAIAALGTALTNIQGEKSSEVGKVEQGQAQIIKRYRSEAVICYDADEAGQAAASKAIDIFLENNIKARVLLLPDCKDPDEYIKKHGTMAFNELLKSAPVAIEFIHRKLKAKFDLSTSEGKIMYSKALAHELAKIDSPIEQEIYARKAADEAGVNFQTVLSEINLHKAAANKIRKQQDNNNKPIANFRVPPAQNIEKELIKLMMAEPQAVDAAKKLIKPEDFSENVQQQLVSSLFEGTSPQQILLDEKFSEFAGEISSILLKETMLTNPKIAANEMSQKILQEKRKRLILELAQSGKIAEMNELIKEGN